MEIGRIHPASAKEAASANQAFYSARVPFALLEKGVLQSLLARQPEQVVMSQDKHTVLVAYLDKKTGKSTHSALISSKYFEKIRDHLGRQQVIIQGEFSSEHGCFIINAVGDSLTAEMAFGTGEEFSPYAAQPMAIVFDSHGKMYLVCQTDVRVHSSGLSKQGKAKFAKAVMGLLSALHNKGFVTGGLALKDVVYDGEHAKVKNPALLQAMTEQDSLRHEVAVTLARLLSAGYITKGQVKGLAKFYLGKTVVGRADVVSKLLQSKGAAVNAHKAISELALKGYL